MSSSYANRCACGWASSAGSRGEAADAWNRHRRASTTVDRPTDDKTESPTRSAASSVRLVDMSPRQESKKLLVWSDEIEPEALAQRRPLRRPALSRFVVQGDRLHHWS